jgi:hypothetical protein
MNSLLSGKIRIQKSVYWIRKLALFGLVLCMGVNVFAGTFIDRGAHPDAKKLSTEKGRTLWTLEGWNGRLYAGFGDAYTSNEGPIPITPWDPATQTFVNVGMAKTEGIVIFRPIAGRLYAPADDGHLRGGDYAVATFDGVEKWDNFRPNGATHSYDLASFDNEDLWFSGENGVFRTTNGGISWAKQPYGGIFLGSYNQKVYVGGIFLTSSGFTPIFKMFDGISWSDAPNLFPQNRIGREPRNFRNWMVYGVNVGDSIENLVFFNGVQATMTGKVMHDFKVYPTGIYTLGTNGVIQVTQDMSTWTTVATAPASARSIGLLDGRLFVGTTDSHILEYSDAVSTKPCVFVRASDAKAYEPGADIGEIEVVRTGNLSSALTVQLDVDGTAQAGSDFTVFSSSVIIPAGAESIRIPIRPINDSSLETNEKVVVTVAENSSYIVEEPKMATVMLYDEDRPTVAVTAADAGASEAGPDSGQFVITRNGSTTSSLVVNLHFNNRSTAKNGIDFVTIPSSVTIPAGASSVTINVTPLQDAIVEISEIVVLTLVSSANYNLGPTYDASMNLIDNNQPSNLIATAISGGQIQLTWKDNSSNEKGFEIFRKVANGSSVLLTSTASNVTTYVNSSLITGTLYTYQLRATIGSSGKSGFSNEASDVAGGGPITSTSPAAPSNLSALSSSSTVVSVYWTDNSSNETGFKIERKTGSTGVYAQVATLGVNATSFSNTGLSASTQYFYRVRATNSTGDSSYSNETGITTSAPPATIPTAPSGLAATSSSSSSVNLSWSDASNNESGFKIERKTGSAGTYAQIATVSANVASFANTGLAASTQYFYRVRATNSAGDSAYSNEANATTQSSSSLSVVSIVANDPNASEAGDKGEFTVSRTGSTAAELKVYLIRSNPNSSTADKEAGLSTDYTVTPTTAGVPNGSSHPNYVLIPAGSASTKIVVTPLADSLIEGTEILDYTVKADLAYQVNTAQVKARVSIADAVTTASAP